VCDRRTRRDGTSKTTHTRVYTRVYIQKAVTLTHSTNLRKKAFASHVRNRTTCCRIYGLGFGVWGLGFGVWGLGFGVWDWDVTIADVKRSDRTLDMQCHSTISHLYLQRK